MSNVHHTVRLTTDDIERRRSRLVSLVEKLPEATVTKHGTHLSMEVRGKRFGWYLQDHHDDERLALNCKAPRGATKTFVTMAPERFHVPKYLGHHGWVGLWLDLPQTDWSEVEVVLAEAYRMTAPKSLVAQLPADDGHS